MHVALSAQAQVAGLQAAGRGQAQVLRRAYAYGAQGTRLRIDQHLFGARYLDEHIAAGSSGLNAVGIDLEHRIGRAYAGVGLDIEQTQVHIDRHRCGRRHGQAAGRQAQGVQVEVQVGKARRLAQHQVDARDSKTAFFAHDLRGLQRQGTDTAPAHRIVLARKQAVEEAHRGVV